MPLYIYFCPPSPPIVFGITFHKEVYKKPHQYSQCLVHHVIQGQGYEILIPLCLLSDSLADMTHGQIYKTLILHRLHLDNLVQGILIVLTSISSHHMK